MHNEITCCTGLPFKIKQYFIKKYHVLKKQRKIISISRFNLLSNDSLRFHTFHFLIQILSFGTALVTSFKPLLRRTDCVDSINISMVLHILFRLNCFALPAISVAATWISSQTSPPTLICVMFIPPSQALRQRVLSNGFDQKWVPHTLAYAQL